MKRSFRDKLDLLQMMWAAAKKDLFIAIPWFPIYSLAEVGLAISSSMLLQLLFVATPTVQISTLIPGRFKNLLPFDYTLKFAEVIFLIPICLISISFIKMVSRFVSTYFTERAGHRTSYCLRTEMLRRFLSSTGNKIDYQNPDRMANFFMQDTALLQDAVSKGTISAIRDCFVLLATIISMLFISFKIFVLGCIIVVCMTMLLRLVSQKLNYYTSGGQKRQINIVTRFLQSYQGALVTNALRSQGREFSDLQEQNAENYKFMRKSLFVRTFFSPVMEFMGILLLAVVFFWRVHTKEDFQSANYSAMVILTLFSFRYIKNIANTITFLSDMGVVYERVTKYFNDYQITPKKNIHFSYLPNYINEAIIAKNISFDIEKSKSLLKNCSLKILKGQKVAFVGESGAGKTTLLRILAGLVVPTEGHVSITENFLMAFQNPYVFRGTVQENIVYNQTSDLTNRVNEKCADLTLALRLAFTESGSQIFLNKKLNFLGSGLSGGEKARVALARILFASPKLILLDEPTANLDPASSKFFWKAIDKWKMKDSEHTIVAISHALSEVQDFDYCYVFHDGKIVNEGIPKGILNAF